jgi:hypothetical protein
MHMRRFHIQRSDWIVHISYHCDCNFQMPLIRLLCKRGARINSRVESASENWAVGRRGRARPTSLTRQRLMFLTTVPTNTAVADRRPLLIPLQPQLYTDLHHGVLCPRPRPLHFPAAPSANRQPDHHCRRRALEVHRPPTARQPQAGHRWHFCCPLSHRVLDICAQPRRRRDNTAEDGLETEPQQLPAA